MIVKVTNLKRTNGGMYTWKIVKYLLFGFIPLYISKSRVN
jgi:hypothetical protein